MNTPHERLEALGTAIPELLLPESGTDLEAWAVIACDQFTQDRAYWESVRARVARAPSTLSLILPEVYLEDGDRKERTERVRSSMREYLDGGTFAPGLRSAVYIERGSPGHPRRRGIVLAVDLERYEWQVGTRPLIRATEGTVPERIPPRMEIRRGAPLEVPHILLLVDDEERRLIEGLGERASARPPLYSTPLMIGAGSIRGWALDREEDWAFMADGLERLAARAAERYGVSGGDPFLYAVGDGNHSLATAKAVWDEYKAAHVAEPGLMDHAARWALVEVENIYDEGIDFEPIHRAVFGVTRSELADALSSLPGFSIEPAPGPAELERLVAEGSPDGNLYGLVSADGCSLVRTTAAGVATEGLQALLDAFVAARPGRSIDYLHGEEETIRVGLRPGAVGLILPPIGKSALFSTVARSGPLPRKSFSMGDAIEKRFYLECRKLFG
ncbi:MAG: hypothetical protein A2Z99_20715 [Treponema sp. GWB1_62_6]|nr:MAG: hypothetical protein A2Z99_20715 [Treponema sp. GWB1_62_6]OHE65244.1 MAG: hypothetical protein A2001_03725 [Treponema sp. GWC1_61_84]OHE75864.1 MAG: hypothetical protein A2413_11610 [Treponema sp. RIFOXYC1_FULL_61_9]HCM26404.1 DUF1015 domain-containing protein [Treponema sp.]